MTTYMLLIEQCPAHNKNSINVCSHHFHWNQTRPVPFPALLLLTGEHRNHSSRGLSFYSRKAAFSHFFFFFKKLLIFRRLCFHFLFKPVKEQLKTTRWLLLATQGPVFRRGRWKRNPGHQRLQTRLRPRGERHYIRELEQSTHPEIPPPSRPFRQQPALFLPFRISVEGEVIRSLPPMVPATGLHMRRTFEQAHSTSDQLTDLLGCCLGCKCPHSTEEHPCYTG